MTWNDLIGQSRFLYDGGMGTLLQASGAELGDCPDALNLTNGDLIARIHADYIAAGAQGVETVTLGANSIKLRRAHKLNDLEAINRAAVKNARAAVGDKLVALSMGPCGDFLAPFGSLSFDELYDSFAAQVKACQPDVYYLETQCDLAETRLGMLAAKENSNLPFAASFTFEGNGRTLMGNTPAVCARVAEALGASAVGINCSGGPVELLPLVKEMREATRLPLIVMPNAGLPAVENGVTHYPFTPEAMAETMVAILEAGADGIGGCCGTTPAHIKAMSGLLKDFGPVKRPSPSPMLVGKRGTADLAEVMKDPLILECQDDMDVYDLLDELEGDEPAIGLDLTAMTPFGIRELLTEGQDALKLPLFFQTKTREQAEAALRMYCGVAGVICQENAEDIAAHYGAIKL